MKDLNRSFFGVALALLLMTAPAVVQSVYAASWTIHDQIPAESQTVETGGTSQATVAHQESRATDWSIRHQIPAESQAIELGSQPLGTSTAKQEEKYNGWSVYHQIPAESQALDTGSAASWTSVAKG